MLVYLPCLEIKWTIVEEDRLLMFLRGHFAHQEETERQNQLDRAGDARRMEEEMKRVQDRLAPLERMETTLKDLSVTMTNLASLMVGMQKMLE